MKVGEEINLKWLQDLSQEWNEVKWGESHGPYVTARTANQDNKTSKIENRLTTGVMYNV